MKDGNHSHAGKMMIGYAVGMAVGACFGIAMKNIGVGLCFGVSFACFFGLLFSRIGSKS